MSLYLFREAVPFMYQPVLVLTVDERVLLLDLAEQALNPFKIFALVAVVVEVGAAGIFTV